MAFVTAGNGAVRAPCLFQQAAHEVADAIAAVIGSKGWTIRGIGIDAPAAAPSAKRRRCEEALSRAGLSCFYTPSISDWKGRILPACMLHTGPVSRLPFANKI